MRVLVAGGAGFLGSHVCAELLRRGHDVVCLDNLLTGQRAHAARLAAHPRCTFVEADAARAPDLAVDLVLHLASPASPADYRRFPLETLRANSAGTERLLELAAAAGARFVFASTSEVYGDPQEHPQRETYPGRVSPTGPRSCYDEAKRFGEALVTAYRRARGVPAAVVRIFNTYGPGMRPDDGRAVPTFVTAALRGRPLPIHGDGAQTRSFCYVTDLVEGLLLVALDPAADGEVLNLGNPEEVTVRELAERVLAVTGGGGGVVHLPPAADDPARRRPDIGRMRARYGWEPRVPLDRGLRETAAAFRAALAARSA
ncbi:MAG TPA: NAD-dependent epimerase/dehydratase family protein [Dehalococcoidia bacterium]